MTSVAIKLAKTVAALTDCLCVMLKEKGAGPTCFCGYVAGEAPAWDYCGECSDGKCGMGYVNVTSVFPSTTFPSPDEAARCATPFAATIVIGALRCFPSPDQSGTLPSEEDMAETWLALNADMGAMLEAIECCDAIEEYVLGSWTPMGPTGGCAGGEWSLTVAL